jgi:hypothetical protein
MLEEEIPEGARIVADADEEGTGVRFTVLPLGEREDADGGQTA